MPAETLRSWVCQFEIDDGNLAGVHLVRRLGYESRGLLEMDLSPEWGIRIFFPFGGWSCSRLRSRPLTHALTPLDNIELRGHTRRTGGL